MNLLMVDDDTLFLEKLKETVQFEEIGIDLVLTAGNIRQAMDILQKYPVDILLSDIEMPQGSGLELLQWIRERKLNLECIFLSSYAYFAYAQKAIALKSSEYLLKPVSERELEKTLKEIVEKRSSVKRADQDTRSKETNLWTRMINGQLPREEVLSKSGSYLFYIASQRKKGLEEQYLSYTMEHLCDQCAENSLPVPEAVIGLEEGSWLIIEQDISSGEGKRAKQCKDTLDQLTGGRFDLYLTKDEVTADTVPDLVRRLRSFAGEAVCGSENLLWMKEWELRSEPVTQPAWGAWETGAVHAETILSTKEKILTYLHTYAEKGRLTAEKLRIFRKELMQMTYNCLRRQNVAVATIFGDEEFDRLYEASADTLLSMDGFVTYVLDKLYGYHSKDHRQESVVEEICRYIEGHLKEDITRKKLAELVFLSEDYVSKLFSATTGTTIPAYITRCRMDKAKEYLESTTLTISQIALETGYTNFSYFSKNFRDYTGMTPNEFRGRETEN